MNAISAVLRKEVSDGVRDRRAVMSAMLFPILAPVLITVIVNVIISIQSSAKDAIVPIQGEQNAPHLVQWLKEHGVTFEPFDGDAQAAVSGTPRTAGQAASGSVEAPKAATESIETEANVQADHASAATAPPDKRLDLVLVIPEDYEHKMREARTAVVEIVTDGTRTSARPTATRIRGLLQQYSSELAALRLVVRGVSPEVMRAVSPQTVDVASKQQYAATALNFIPLYIVLAAFISGLGLAVDATAGERERMTLEPLLISPASRRDIVIGKWIAASLFAAFGVGLTLILCLVAASQLPLDKINLTFQISTAQAAGMLGATLPVAFLATSMQMLLGSFAKSFKDAQSYIGILTMLPMVPFMFALFSPMATQTWMYAVPLLGQHLLVADATGGKALLPLAMVLSGGCTLLAAFGFALITARLFNRESMLRT